MAFYALYLLMLADKLIKKFDSRFLVSDTENIYSLLTKRKKRTRPRYSCLDRTSLVNKGLIIWPKRELFLSGPTWEIPERVAN